jgi:hypothetical protein
MDLYPRAGLVEGARQVSMAWCQDVNALVRGATPEQVDLAGDLERTIHQKVGLGQQRLGPRYLACLQFPQREAGVDHDRAAGFA